MNINKALIAFMLLMALTLSGCAGYAVYGYDDYPYHYDYGYRPYGFYHFHRDFDDFHHFRDGHHEGRRW